MCSVGSLVGPLKRPLFSEVAQSWGAFAAFAAAKPHFYVDSVTGSDADSGTSADLAKQTLAGWLALGSDLIGKRTEISGKFPHQGSSENFVVDGFSLSGPSMSDRATLTGWLAVSPAWERFEGAGGSEYATNGSFTTWTGTYPTSWNSEGTVAKLSKVTTSGDNAILISGGATTAAAGINQTMPQTFTEGDVVTLSVDHVETLGASAGLRLFVATSTGAGANKHLQADGTWGDFGAGSQLINVSKADRNSRTIVVAQPIPAGYGDVTLKCQLTRWTFGTGNNGTIAVYDVSVTGPSQVANENTWRVACATIPQQLLIEDQVGRASGDILSLDENDWKLDTGYIYLATDGTDPNTLDVFKGDLSIGLNVFSASARSNVRVSNLHLEGYNRDALKFWLLTNSMVENISGRANAGDDTSGQSAMIRADYLDGVTFRRIVAEKLRGESIFAWESKNCTFDMMWVKDAESPTADCFQLTAPSGEAGNNLISNFYWNQTTLVGPKGCGIVGGDGTRFSHGTVVGGRFGISHNGSDCVIENVDGSGQNGTSYASGLRFSQPESYANNLYRHNRWHDAFHGVYFELGTGEGGGDFDPDATLTNFWFEDQTVDGNTLGGYTLLRSIGGGIRRGTVYNPSAPWDFNLNVLPPVGQTFTLDGVTFGPARTGQFKVYGVSYNSLAEMIAAAPAQLVITGCTQLAGAPDIVADPTIGAPNSDRNHYLPFPP